MQITQSEKLFEKFCENNCIPFLRIATGKSRTPDYEIYLRRRWIGFPRHKVIVEIKEITPNPEEQKAKKILVTTKMCFSKIVPGERVRKKISDASPQLRLLTKGRHPGLLVLYDVGFAVGHLDAYQIRVGMYGFETLVITTPPDFRESPHLVARKYGPRRKCTKKSNTSVSAIAVFRTSQMGDISVSVYHNVYAAVPLPVAWLTRFGCSQFRLGPAEPERIAGWQAIYPQQIPLVTSTGSKDIGS